MSNIIKNVAVLALINSVEAHKINQSANIGVRFIEQPRPDDSINVLIQDPSALPQKSAQDKLFDQMDKEEDEQNTRMSLEQTKTMQKENMNADQKSKVDQNSAYRSFVDDKFKPVPESAPVVSVAEVKKVQKVETVKATSVPKPTVGHFREQEQQLSQAEQDKNTAHNLVQAAISRTGGDTTDPEYQLAVADASKMQDGDIVDKQLQKIDTDAENNAAIEKSLGNIVSDEQKNENVNKDAQKQKDLQYMSQYGTTEEKTKALSELNAQNQGQIMGSATSVVFDPITATMQVKSSNKPLLNNLAENKSMEVHNNVPKAVMAPEHEKISAAQAGILKYAVGAYPADTITEIDN